MWVPGAARVPKRRTARSQFARRTVSRRSSCNVFTRFAFRTILAPQDDRIQRRQQPGVIAGLRISAEGHRRHHGPKAGRGTQAPAAEHPIGGQQSQRHPRGSHQEHDVAHLIEHVAAEHVRHGRRRRSPRRGVPAPGQPIGRPQGQRHVPQHIEPIGPGRIDRQGKDPSWRIEQRRGGISRQRHPQVLIGVPERGRARCKLLSRELVERIVVVSRIAKHPDPVREQRSTKHPDEESGHGEPGDRSRVTQG